ncbi:MAG: hypothetical protein ACRDWX_11375 [Acidimicrobiia bacterium]
MAAVPASAARPGRLNDWSSVWAVVAVTLLALLAGWVVRSAVENRSRLVEGSEVTAAVPAGWMVQEGFDELRLVTWNAPVPEERYSVSVLPEAGAPIDAAAERNRRRAQLLGTYRLLEEMPVVIDGRDGYRVGFAYVPTGRPGLPTVVQGVDYYYQEDGAVTVVSLEAPQDRFTRALPRFLRFLASVEVGGS